MGEDQHLLPSYKTLADLVSASGEQTEALDALTQDLAKRAEKLKALATSLTNWSRLSSNMQE